MQRIINILMAVFFLSLGGVYVMCLYGLCFVSVLVRIDIHAGVEDLIVQRASPAPALPVS